MNPTHRHYRMIDEIGRTKKVDPMLTRDVLEWLAPRVMILGLTLRPVDNVMIARQFKLLGVNLPDWTDEVYQFWAAHQIKHTVWEMDRGVDKTALDLLQLFEVVPETANRALCTSDREYEDQELVIGAQHTYRKHLQYLHERRVTIETTANAYFS